MASVEGVWAKDIEEAFEEALAVYPPCGRRKIILSDEGKMYGRNELIARYIKMRTGKTRTRKQVSSHIQVLSRKRGREGDKGKMVSQQSPSRTNGTPQMMNRTGLPISGLPNPALQNPVYPPPMQGIGQPSSPVAYNYPPPSGRGAPFMSPYLAEKSKKPVPPHPDSLIYSPSSNAQSMTKLNHGGPPRTSLFEFSVFLECSLPSPSLHTFAELKDVDFAGPLEKVDIRQMYPKLPGLQQLYNRGPRDAIYLVKLWLNLSAPTLSGFLGMTSKYHSGKSTSIKVSSKIFEHGKQILEKIQVEYPMLDNGSYCYFFNRAPACEYAINLLDRARECLLMGTARGGGEEAANEILNDIAVLQTVTDRDTQENLLSLLFIFEAGDEQLARRVYKLTEE